MIQSSHTIHRMSCHGLCERRSMDSVEEIKDIPGGWGLLEQEDLNVTPYNPWGLDSYDASGTEEFSHVMSLCHIRRQTVLVTELTCNPNDIPINVEQLKTDLMSSLKGSFELNNILSPGRKL